MSSFYLRRSHKCKKDSQVKQLFALLGSARVKALRKNINEIDPRCNFAARVTSEITEIAVSCGALFTLSCGPQRHFSIYAAQELEFFHNLALV